MANILTIAKAEAVAVSLGALTKQTPTFKTAPDGKITVYWTPDQLPAVQEWFKTTMNAPGGDLDVDFLPAIVPWAMPKVLPYALGLLIAGFLVAKIK